MSQDGGGGGVERGGAEEPGAGRGRGLRLAAHTMGEAAPGGGAGSNHGIRPRAQRGRRFRKLPRRHSVAPFKGEVLKEGGSGVDLERIFGRWTLRFLGWVFAQNVVGAQALLCENEQKQVGAPGFCPLRLIFGTPLNPPSTCVFRIETFHPLHRLFRKEQFISQSHIASPLSFLLKCLIQKRKIWTRIILLEKLGVGRNHSSGRLFRTRPYMHFFFFFFLPIMCLHILTSNHS